MSQNLQVEGGPRTRSSSDDTADLRTSGGAASSNPVSSFSSFDGPADAASGALGRRGAMPREEIGGGMETDENEIDSCSCLLNGRQDSYQFLLNMIAALPGDARYDQATAICGALGDDEWRAGRMGTGVTGSMRMHPGAPERERPLRRWRSILYTGNQ